MINLDIEIEKTGNDGSMRGKISLKPTEQKQDPVEFFNKELGLQYAG